MHVNKDKVKVVAYVNEWRVEGELHVLMDSRLTDALNSRSKEFIVITDAKIYDAKTNEFLVATKFIDVNRANISVVYTVD